MISRLFGHSQNLGEVSEAEIAVPLLRPSILSLLEAMSRVLYELDSMPSQSQCICRRNLRQTEWRSETRKWCPGMHGLESFDNY